MQCVNNPKGSQDKHRTEPSSRTDYRSEYGRQADVFADSKVSRKGGGLPAH